MADFDTNGLSKKRADTAQGIIKALKETKGLLTMAAHKAGVSYSTVKRYAAEFQSVKDAVHEAKESMVDFTESKLFEKIKNGDTVSIIFYLKTQGKGRGYTERQEVEHSGNIGRATELSDDELYAIIENRRSQGIDKETGSS